MEVLGGPRRQGRWLAVSGAGAEYSEVLAMEVLDRRHQLDLVAAGERGRSATDVARIRDEMRRTVAMWRRLLSQHVPTSDASRHCPRCRRWGGWRRRRRRPRPPSGDGPHQRPGTQTSKGVTVDRDAIAAHGCAAAARRHRGVELSASVQRLLLDIVADGFIVYCCGPRTDPAALVASYEWEHYVDVVTIRDFDRRVVAARVPKQCGEVDVFAPDLVVWAYEGPAEPTLRAVLDLVHPDHPDAPTSAFPAPPALRVARHEQRPMTIRPPSPGQAGARAARLHNGCRPQRTPPTPKEDIT